MQMWSGILTVALGVMAILGAWAECVRPATPIQSIPRRWWQTILAEGVHLLRRVTTAGWFVLISSIVLTVAATLVSARADAQNEKRSDQLIAAQDQLLSFRSAEAWRDSQLSRISHRTASMCQFDLVFQNIDRFLAAHRTGKPSNDSSTLDEAIIGFSITLQLAKNNWHELLLEFKKAGYANDEPQGGDPLMQLELAIQRFETCYRDLDIVIKNKDSYAQLDDAAFGELSARLAWIGLEVGAANCEARGLARVIIEREFSHKLLGLHRSD